MTDHDHLRPAPGEYDHRNATCHICGEDGMHRRKKGEKGRLEHGDYGPNGWEPKHPPPEPTPEP